MQVVFFRSKKSPEDRFCFPLPPSSPTLGWGTASHLRGIMWSSNFQIEGDDLYKCIKDEYGLFIRKYLVPCPRPRASKSFKAASNLLVPENFSSFITECWSALVQRLRLASPPSQVAGRITSCSLGRSQGWWWWKGDRLRRKLLHLMSFWFQVCNVIPPLLLMVTQQQRCWCGWQQWCHTHDDDSAVAGETNC